MYVDVYEATLGAEREQVLIITDQLNKNVKKDIGIKVRTPPHVLTISRPMAVQEYTFVASDMF